MSNRVRTSTLPATGGGVIRRTILPTGTRVITETMPGVRSASVGVWVPIGSRHETASVSGASHFLEHLLFKGTPTRTAMQIAVAMDAVGGEFNAFTEKEHTCYYATVLDRELPMAIDMICDIVLNATVTAADVEVERAVVLEEISMRDDDPSDRVHDEFAEAMFGDTALGRSILGSESSIQSLSRTQVNGYYRRRYRPADMVVAIAGNIDHAAAVSAVRRCFGGQSDHVIRESARTSVKRSSLTPAQTTRVLTDDSEQANIVLGTAGMSRFDDRRFVLSVLSAALGGGMSSRLFQQIREQRGLAYSTYSFTSSYRSEGAFGMYAGCQPAKAAEVISIMSAILDDAGQAGVSEAEVDRAKGQLAGSMVLGLEDSGSRMSRIGKAELTFGEVLGLDQLLARVAAVTSAQVNELVEQLANQPRCLTVVGPFGVRDFAAAV